MLHRLMYILLLIEESRTPYFLPYQDIVNLISQSIKMLMLQFNSDNSKTPAVKMAMSKMELTDKDH